MSCMTHTLKVLSVAILQSDCLSISYDESTGSRRTKPRDQANLSSITHIDDEVCVIESGLARRLQLTKTSSPPFRCCCTVRRRRCSQNRERQASISGYLYTSYTQQDISYAQPTSSCPDSPPWSSSESPRLSMLVNAAPFDRIANPCGPAPTAAMVPVIPSRQVTYTSTSGSNASKNNLTL
jgi:hypothetical protein